jgi:hypothetical protein
VLECACVCLYVRVGTSPKLDRIQIRGRGEYDLGHLPCHWSRIRANNHAQNRRWWALALDWYTWEFVLNVNVFTSLDGIIDYIQWFALFICCAVGTIRMPYFRFSTNCISPDVLMVTPCTLLAELLTFYFLDILPVKGLRWIYNVTNIDSATYNTLAQTLSGYHLV